MTIEELSALPIFEDYETLTLPTGEMVQHRKIPELVPYRGKPDDVILFTDEEGSWFVEYHFRGGPYKRRAIL
jgi:hypothetical protein